MIFRCEKGKPLTFLEMDQNFQEILDHISSFENRITKIEESLFSQPSQPFFIDQEGEEIVFKGPEKKEYGRVRLPIFRPNLRGEWCAKEYYHMHDWVVVKGHTYGCIDAHVSEHFEEDCKKWRIVMGTHLLHQKEDVHGGD